MSINRSINLAVCILFYEKLDQTIQCIRSFLPSGVNIFVLNNDSSSKGRQKLGEFIDEYNQIKIFDSPVNLGSIGGRNFLINHTNEEWLLFPDSDIIVKTPDWLQKFKQHVHLNRDIEVFIPRLFCIPENIYASKHGIRVVGTKASYNVKPANDLINIFSAGASFINRELFNRLGPYDEKMFVGFSEAEISIRAILAGKPVKGKLIHDIELIHSRVPATKEEDKRAVLTRYNTDLLEASLNRITEKHNVTFEVDWKKWVSEQVEYLTSKRTFFSKVKKQLVSWRAASFKRTAGKIRK